MSFESIQEYLSRKQTYQVQYLPYTPSFFSFTAPPPPKATDIPLVIPVRLQLPEQKEKDSLTLIHQELKTYLNRQALSIHALQTLKETHQGFTPPEKDILEQCMVLIQIQSPPDLVEKSREQIQNYLALPRAKEKLESKNGATSPPEREPHTETSSSSSNFNLVTLSQRFPLLSHYPSSTTSLPQRKSFFFDPSLSPSSES